MDSPAPRHESAGAPGSRRRLWLLAITLWTSFLGAALTLLLAMTLLPAEATAGFGWAELSVGFLSAWLLAMVTVSLALMLALPLDVGRRPQP